MKKVNKKWIISLGVALFSLCLGSGVIYADEMVDTTSQGTFGDTVIPDLPSDSDLTPEEHTSTTSSDNGEETIQSTTQEPEIPTIPDEPVVPDTPITTPSETQSENIQGNTTTSSETPKNGNTENQSASETPVQSQQQVQSQEQKEQEAVQPVVSHNVVVRSDGTVGNATQSAVGTVTNEGTVVPIKTSNLSELTHIPTLVTPVETENGEKIVSVVDGVPYKQTENGLEQATAEVTKLPSGNISVKGSDGKIKVLPQTGSRKALGLTILGGLMVVGVGSRWYIMKQKKEKKERKQ